MFGRIPLWPGGTKRVRKNRSINLAAAAIVVTAGCHAPIAARRSPPAATGTLHRVRELNPHLAADDPRALPMKLRSLLRDEYRFFRGSAGLFYAWCAINCRDWLKPESDWVRLHGDPHIGNIGTYPTQCDGSPRWGVVDLDESVVGPFQLDLLRAMTAIQSAAIRQERPLSPAESHRAAQALCEAYVEALRGRCQAADLPSRQPIVATLLEKARSGRLTDTTSDYCRPETPPCFRRSRSSKNGDLKDVMKPATEEERRHLVEALWQFVANDTGPVGQTNPYTTPDMLNAAVHDVVRWARVGSSGSQGLRKYLVLMDWVCGGQRHELIVQFKEEPAPAAVRAGLLPATPGADRGREVANAYVCLQSPPMWFVGHASIGDRSFLIKTKNPWTHEPDPDDFDGPDRLADLLGSTLGAAHRTATLRDGRTDDHIHRMASGAKTLAPDLANRSLRVTRYLQAEYYCLSANPRARELAAQADQFLTHCWRGPKRDT
jgi:uncharacterized protein (DUF2252 family)